MFPFRACKRGQTRPPIHFRGGYDMAACQNRTNVVLRVGGLPRAMHVPYPASNHISHPVPCPLAGREEAPACGHPPLLKWYSAMWQVSCPAQALRRAAASEDELERLRTLAACLPRGGAGGAGASDPHRSNHGYGQSPQCWQGRLDPSRFFPFRRLVDSPGHWYRQSPY